MVMQTDVRITQSTTQNNRNGRPRTNGSVRFTHGIRTSTPMNGGSDSANLAYLPALERAGGVSLMTGHASSLVGGLSTSDRGHSRRPGETDLRGPPASALRQLEHCL